MIKGLYFKLNVDKQPDKEIYEFFEKESKRTGFTKLHLLNFMISLYCAYRMEQIRLGGKDNV